MDQLALRVTRCKVVLGGDASGRLKAHGSIVLNDAFAVNVKIIKGDDRLFVAMPALPRKDGMFYDVAHPITQELREHIESVVLEEYQRVTGESQQANSRSAPGRGAVNGRSRQACAVGAGR